MIPAHDILGYHVLSTLGSGAGSTIYAVRDKRNQVYALKQVIRKTANHQRFLDQAFAEHAASRKIDHEGVRKSFKIIKQRAVIRTSAVYVLMEMVDGRTAEKYWIKPREMDMIEFCQMMIQVADALEAMHRAGYIHCDIKPSNIMITHDNGVKKIKLIDLGQSCVDGTVKDRIQGTPDYIAPEQVKRRRMTPQTDVFNLGATMYCLVSGKCIPTLMPNRSVEDESTEGSVLKNVEGDTASLEVNDDTERMRQITPPLEINPKVPPALSSLIMNCVAYGVADRPESMRVVRERLEMAVMQLQRVSKPKPKRLKSSRLRSSPQDSSERSGTQRYAI